MKIPVKRYWELLARYLKPQWRQVVLLGAILLISIVLNIVSPQLIRYFIDAATQGDSLNQLLLAGGTFLGFSLIAQVLGVVSVYLSDNIGWRATNALRADLALFGLRLDMSFHNQKTPGEMIARVDGDVVDLTAFFSQFVVNIGANIVLIVGILIVLLFQDWRLGLMLGIYTTIALSILNRMREVAVGKWKDMRDADTALSGYLEEKLAGLEDLRSSGARDYALNDLYTHSAKLTHTRVVAGLTEAKMRQVWAACVEVGHVVAVLGAFYLFVQGQITIGTVYLLFAYVETIFRPLREIAMEMQNLQRAGGSLEHIEELYAVQSKIKDDGTRTLDHGPLSITFDNVHFSYNNQDSILEQLSFSLKPCEVLGLLGRTGSGKTTITRLLFRLYDVTQGGIRLNGIELRDLALSEIQHHIGIVTQDVQLFHATVRDNLTFFDRAITDAQMLNVLEELGLVDWLHTLPEGLDTMLESGGQSLSAGEAQLLAFARVFLKDPGLVIMDEASSRLDPLTEAKIEQAITKLLHNRTGIIVAHRLQTVARADTILILDQGMIKEYGDYRQLAANPTSRLSQLMQTGLQEVLA